LRYIMVLQICSTVVCDRDVPVLPVLRSYKTYLLEDMWLRVQNGYQKNVLNFLI